MVYNHAFQYLCIGICNSIANSMDSIVTKLIVTEIKRFFGQAALKDHVLYANTFYRPKHKFYYPGTTVCYNNEWDDKTKELVYLIFMGLFFF